MRESDFLHMDPDSITPGPIAVIGNFPYNISTEIVFKVLAHRDRFPELVGMFQKEVADRFCSGPGNRTYGITSVIAQVWYDMEVLFMVEPRPIHSTTQGPKCRDPHASEQHHLHTVDEKLLVRVVKTAFNQRRKTLHNALKGFPNLPNGVPSEFAKKRAEQLTVEDFIALTAVCSD